MITLIKGCYHNLMIIFKKKKLFSCRLLIINTSTIKMILRWDNWLNLVTLQCMNFQNNVFIQLYTKYSKTTSHKNGPKKWAYICEKYWYNFNRVALSIFIPNSRTGTIPTYPNSQSLQPSSCGPYKINHKHCYLIFLADYTEQKPSFPFQL